MFTLTGRYLTYMYLSIYIGIPCFEIDFNWSEIDATTSVKDLDCWTNSWRGYLGNIWWDIHLDPRTLAWVSGLPKKRLILRLPEPLPAKADLVQLTFANLYETKLPKALRVFKSLLSTNKLPRSKLSLLLNWDVSKFKFAHLNFLIVNSWFLQGRIKSSTDAGKLISFPPISVPCRIVAWTMTHPIIIAHIWQYPLPGEQNNSPPHYQGKYAENSAQNMDFGVRFIVNC